MLTEGDIEKMKSVFATKPELDDVKEALIEAIGIMRNDMLTGFDSIIKAIDDLRMEYVAMKMQLDRHERWIRELAEKVGYKLTD